MGCKEDCCIGSHPFWWFLTLFLCYLSPKILIFQELLIIETWKKCHWIWHVLNPKYDHSSHFDKFFPVKINKMWNFCLKLWFFMNHLLYRLKTCTIGFGTPQTLNMCHSSHFRCFFPSQNQQNDEIFGSLLEHPLTKNEKNSIWIGKSSV